MAAVAETGDDEGEPPKSRLWLRFLTAAFVIVISMATATAVAGLLFLTDIAKGLGRSRRRSRASSSRSTAASLRTSSSSAPTSVPATPAPAPTRRCCCGSTPTRTRSRSSRFRATSRSTSPATASDRLNAAYSYGGPKLTLETVKQLTGLKINHVVNVDFQASPSRQRDRLRLRRRRPLLLRASRGAPTPRSTSTAGYQLLCGERALQYVRYRHADTDLMRSARQQDFLREARQKITPRAPVPRPRAS